jgi:hypothetical protein
VSLIYCEPCKPQGHSYSRDPAIYSQTWLLLLAVIRCYPAKVGAKKARISGVHPRSFAVFSVHISEYQRRLRRGGDLR